MESKDLFCFSVLIPSPCLPLWRSQMSTSVPLLRHKHTPGQHVITTQAPWHVMETWARTSKTQRRLWAADSEMWGKAQTHPPTGVVWNMWATLKPNIWAQAASWGNYSAFLSWLAWAQQARRYRSRRDSASDWLPEIPSVGSGEYAGEGACRKHIHVQGS